MGSNPTPAATEVLRLVGETYRTPLQRFTVALTSAYAAFVVTVWWRRLAVPRRYKEKK